eukprot:3622508-Amphidinium_carterae.1
MTVCHKCGYWSRSTWPANDAIFACKVSDFSRSHSATAGVKTKRVRKTGNGNLLPWLSSASTTSEFELGTLPSCASEEWRS